MFCKVFLQPCAMCTRTYARRLIQRSIGTIKGRSAEDKTRTLYLGMNHTEATLEDVRNLSEDIVGVDMKSLGPEKSFAFVEFRTKELANEHHKKFKEMGINVRFTGDIQKTLSENDRKQLHLVFPNTGVTKEDIARLSEDIVNIEISRKPNFCSAVVTFPSEACANENYKRLQEQGLDVNFVGDNKKASKESLRLWMGFKNSKVRKEDIRQLSEDIVDVDLKWQSRKFSFAFATFPTEDLADKNCRLFKEKGFTVRYLGQKQKLISELDGNSLLLRFPNGPDRITEEFVRNLSEDISDVSIVPGENGSFAVVTFPSKELAEKNLATFEENKTFFTYVKEESMPDKDSKALWIALPYPDITVEKVRKLSEDIVSVSLHWRGQELCFAFVEFSSEELREKNFVTLQSKGLKVFFKKEKEKDELLSDNQT